MKKGMNKGSAKRVVIILSLCLALLIALGAFSFAWIRNYVDVDNLEVKTGKMLYNFKLYRVNGDKVTSVNFFDTNTPEDFEAGNTEAKLEKNLAANPLINIEDGEEVFFVIEKYADSIDFDVAISFDNDGRPENFENIGQMNYKIFNDSDALSKVDNQSALENYLKVPGENPAEAANLANIWGRAQKASLEGTQKYAVIRLKIAKNPGVSAELEDRSFPFRVSFCVAQKDALPDDEKTDKFYVDSKEMLEKVMGQYGFGDEIYITKDIEDYSGDLVFTRPCTVALVRSTLTIHGNLVFSYMYGNKFVLNTLSDGHIKILKQEGVDGNFQIDLPNTTIELVGANNDANGKADIYVEGSFTANTSNKEGEGLFFSGSRICDITLDESNNLVYSNDLKPVLINGSTRISISNRTRVGLLSVNSNCRRFILQNSGHIDQISLSEMAQDLTLLSTPAILIDNAGSVGVVDTETNIIQLPNWSRKFNKNDIKSPDDNTHIIANKGSGKILAITPNNYFGEDPSVVESGNFFFSDGKQGVDGYPDHIDYMLRTQFVEAVNGDKTKVVIHYETPSPNILRESQYKDLESLTTLKSYIDYYSAKEVIAPAGELKEVTVICYGDKALTSPPLKDSKNPSKGYVEDLTYDYNFVKSMQVLTKLDLSDAVSVDKKVPDNAFKGMSKLTSVQMSESDTFWGKYIFTGTGIDEITFPQSLTTLDNPADNIGVNSQESLDGIRYVYTSITVVDGIYANKSAIQYYFVPDDFTCEEYCKLNGATEWHARVFLNNGVKRYGEYFLRYDPNSKEVVPTCEFVVFTGGVDLVRNASGKTIEKRKPWLEEEDFDFNNMRIDGKVYKIISFDSYAFFNKLYNEDLFSLVLDTNIKSIGKYAFACGTDVTTASGLASVTIKGDPKIMGNAFEYNDALVEFNAPELTSLNGGYNLSNNIVLKTVYMPKLSVVAGIADLGNCPKLQRADIGVIEQDDINRNFYIAIKVDYKNSEKIISNDTKLYASYSYAKFYIHTEYAKDVSAYTNALAADNRYIFVKESYAKLYRATETYTGVTDMGENPLSALIAADEDGNDLTDGKQPAYYYVIDGSNAKLVACLLSEINENHNDHNTIASFNHEGVTYPVTYIGSAAYYFTDMKAQNIKISDGITELGAYAFYSEIFKKYCITLDLNDVVKVGSYAFYCMDMARIVGNALEEVGNSTLSNNKNLIVANLPNLSRSRPAGSADSKSKVFVLCENLRLAYVGYSDDIAYDVTNSLKNSYIRFVNFVSGSEKIELPKVNTVINNSYPTVDTKTFTTNLVKTDKMFSGIYLSDYYDYEVELMGLSDTIELPGYVYSMQENGELSLIAVSPDLQIFGDYKINANGGSDYTTPGKLYASGDRYTAKDNGTTVKFTVTSLGKYAYGAVSIVGVDNFIVADSVKVLDIGALCGSAFVDSMNSIKTLKDVKTLNLTNVVELGTYACKEASVKEIIALNVKVVGESAFLNCKMLENVYLPSFMTAVGSYTFKGCESLKGATFGEQAETFAYNMFDGDSSLQKITILRYNGLVKIGTSLISKTYAQNIKVVVPKAIYNDYVKTFESGFGNIPIEKFTYFENASTLGSATYYWNVLDEAAKTAYIDYVEGTLSATLEFPSEFDGYKVVAISPNAISSLSDDVTKIVLPDNMEYLTFNTSDLTVGIKALEIADSNSKFKTVDGVLYSEDGKVLYIYPKSKESTDFIVNATVTEIAYRAFYQDEKHVSALETLTIAGVVTIRDQAFENSSIGLIKFTSTTASVFAGKDILLGANSLLRISVPNASLGAFKSNVLMDYSILGRFIGA